MRAQLQAGQKLVLRDYMQSWKHIAAEAMSMKRVTVERQHDRGQKKEAQFEDTVIIMSLVTELALRACSHWESRKTKSAPCLILKLQNTGTWVEWMATHIPT